MRLLKNWGPTVLLAYVLLLVVVNFATLAAGALDRLMGAYFWLLHWPIALIHHLFS